METSRGYWERRRGGLIRLENDAGQVGFGEVAPIQAFGTETLEEAFLDRLHELIAQLRIQLLAAHSLPFDAEFASEE